MHASRDSPTIPHHRRAAKRFSTTGTVGAAILLAGTEKGESPFFAPDGEWIRARATTAVPTSNADIAPTIMHLMGLTPAPSMTGRVLAEVLRSRRGSNRPRVRRDSVEVCQSLTGTDVTEFRVTLHRSCVGATMYADSTVTRRTVHGEAIGFLQAREDAVGHPPPRLGNPAESRRGRIPPHGRADRTARGCENR